MKNGFQVLEQAWEKKIDATGLALFRIAYGLVLLMEVLELWEFKEYYFDIIPFIEPCNHDFSFILKLWIGVVCFLILGAFTRWMAVINWCFSLVIFAEFKMMGYHWDFSMSTIHFLLIFMPVSNRLSIDKWISATFYSKPLPDTAPKLIYLGFAYLCLGLLYFDSFFQKLPSRLWLDGLSVWLPSSIPNFSSLHKSLHFFLNNEYFMLFASYITLLFEFLFVFLFWHKRFRLPLFLIGMGLHLGIYLALPIPWFGLGMMSIYMVLIPIGFYDTIRKKTEGCLTLLQKIIKRDLTPVHSLECKASEINKLNSNEEIFRFKREKVKQRLWILFLVYATTVQLSLIYLESMSSAYFHLLKLGNEHSLTRFWEKSNQVLDRTWFKIPKHLGLVSHGVFIDDHFNGYEHSIAIVYKAKEGKEVFLPVMNEAGHPDYYNLGRRWTYWSFQVNSARIHQNKVKSGIQRLTAFWAVKNGVSLEDATFEVRVKKIEIPRKWEKDFMKKLYANPWISAGTATWKQKIFSTEIMDIESI